MRRYFVTAATLGPALACLLLLARCASPVGPKLDPELVITPIPIESVEVIQQTFPPIVSAHVRGYLGDGCSSLHSIRQERSGSLVTITILAQRPRDAICTQIAKLFDELIRLQGQYPPGRYVLRVNDVERVFTTR